MDKGYSGLITEIIANETIIQHITCGENALEQEDQSWTSKDVGDQTKEVKIILDSLEFQEITCIQRRPDSQKHPCGWEKAYGRRTKI